MHKVFKENYPHFEDLKSQILQLAIDHDLSMSTTNLDRQIAIQTRIEGKEDWLNGIGKTFFGVHPHTWELEFKYLQPSLVGTPIDDYFKWLDVEVYRTRIMLIKTKRCYSLHTDHSPRLHLPITTNPHCNFVLTEPQASVFHLPANGDTYWVDTRNHHTFMNGGGGDRIHLVMIVKD